VRGVTGGVASARRAEAAERRERAWELRKRGYTFRQIADELKPLFPKYSKSSAERDIKAVLHELTTRTLNSAAEERALDLARLDELLTGWFSRAAGVGMARPMSVAEGEDTDPLAELRASVQEQGLDKNAAEVVLKILEQRAKLIGLYRQEVALTTPEPLQVTADLSGLDEESLDAIIRNLQAAISAGGR